MKYFCSILFFIKEIEIRKEIEIKLTRNYPK